MLETDQKVVEELTRLSARLVLVSESDYPLTIINWPGEIEVNADYLRGLTDESRECSVEQMSLEQLFADGRFEGLTNSLRRHLQNVKAYKVGTINMPVYIVGKGPEGNWLGVSSRIVQT